MRRRAGGVVALALLVAVATTRAATVEVTVRERGGPTLSRASVSLEGMSPARPSFHELAGAAGRATFEDVPPDTYTVLARADTDHVGWPEDPLSVRSMLQVREGQERARLTVELTATIDVRCQLRASPDATSPAWILATHEETGTSFQQDLREEWLVGTTLRLVPGVWRLALRPPPGYVVTNVVRDGFEVTGCVVRLPIEEHGPRVDVDWTIASTASASGTILRDSGGCGAGGMRATVETPGAVMAASRARGCVVSGVVEAALDRNCRWSMVLPDGIWTFEPIVREGATWEPQARGVEVAFGGHAKVDMVTTVPDAEQQPERRGSQCVVKVIDPDGQLVDGASVRAWADGSDGKDGTALASGTTREGLVVLRGMEPQPVRFVASHRSFVEGETASDSWAIAPGERAWIDTAGERLVVVRLGHGCTVDVVAKEADGTPASGVVAVVTSLGDPPRLVVLAGTVEQWRSRANATDGEGRARVTAVRPGEKVVACRAAGERRSTHAVQVRREGGAWVERVPLELGADCGVTKIEARVVPQGSVVATLRCDAGGRLPPVASVLAVPMGTFDQSRVTEKELLAVPGLRTRDGFFLQGDERDVVRFGPLAAGSWLVAVRPEGFDRWTWAPGKDAIAEAVVTAVEPGEPTPLPPVVVECRPIVVVAQDASSAMPRLDLRLARCTAKWRPIDARDRYWGLGGELTIVRSADALELRGASEGSVDVHVEVEHPHLLAPGPIVLEPELKLRDGRIARVTLPVPPGGVGGALEVRAPAGEVVVRAVGSEAWQPGVAVVDGRALVAHLPAGRYEVEVRGADGSVARAWTSVVVEVSRTVVR